MTLIVAPTEPAQFRAIADVVSMASEKMGVDAMWTSKYWGMVGVQRKEYRDLIASVADGRLAREVAQMQRLGLAVLMIEGRMRWTMDGQLVDSYTKWTKAQHRGIVRSVQSKGIWVETTDNLGDTVAAVQDLMKWTDRPRHNSLDRRPGPVGAWGKASERDFALHLLQSFDGIGPEVAGRIYDHFDGRVPLQWTCTPEELAQIAGVGPKKVETLMAALDVHVPSGSVLRSKAKRSAGSGKAPRTGRATA